MTDGKVRYGFSRALSGFFEMPAETARRLVPAPYEPVELHHGVGVLSVTAFDFTQSQVGAYGEVVLAVLVAPLVKQGEPFPKAAMYPYRVATTTRAAREHAIELWHLPHWMEDVEVQWKTDEPLATVSVRAGGARVLELSIHEHSWAPVTQRFQTFMKDEAGRYMATMVFEGTQSEHEDERGKLELHAHAFNQELPIPDVYDIPFRELWMREGVQTFDPLVTLPGPGKR